MRRNLEPLLAWVRSHGNVAWIEGDAIAIRSGWSNAETGESGWIVEYARDQREARWILGY